MVVAHIGSEHQTVGHEITGFGIEAETEFLIGAIGKSQAGGRGSYVLFTLFKLRIGCHGCDEEQQEGHQFLHDGNSYVVNDFLAENSVFRPVFGVKEHSKLRFYLQKPEKECPV